MGLDIVELVIRCEEHYEVKLEDWRLEKMRTVGDLFELICEQLKLPFGPEAPLPQLVPMVERVIAPRDDWTRDTAWTRLVRICSDQLQLDTNEITYRASFVDDLGTG